MVFHDYRDVSDDTFSPFILNVRLSIGDGQTHTLQLIQSEFVRLDLVRSEYPYSVWNKCHPFHYLSTKLKDPHKLTTSLIPQVFMRTSVGSEEERLLT